jgi:hypothetical protein
MQLKGLRITKHGKQELADQIAFTMACFLNVEV